MEISSHLTLVPSTGLMVKGTEMSSPPTLLTERSTAPFTFFVSELIFLQVYDTVGWVIGKVSGSL